MITSRFEKFINVFEKNHGILKLSQAVKLGVPKYIVYEMFSEGILLKEEKGIYRLSTTEPLGNPDLVQVSLLVPKSVVCLISALYFHGLTTQVPHGVHIALPNNIPKPRIEYPPLDVYWLSKNSYASGIGEYALDGVLVRIYNREKTIADCFKFRKRIGEAIAIEALKDYMGQPKRQIDDILRYARINRVEKVIQPYLRTILT
jgi:predicted transcriptional regulator of viral defense system